MLPVTVAPLVTLSISPGPTFWLPVVSSSITSSSGSGTGSVPRQ